MPYIFKFNLGLLRNSLKLGYFMQIQQVSNDFVIYQLRKFKIFSLPEKFYSSLDWLAIHQTLKLPLPAQLKTFELPPNCHGAPDSNLLAKSED